MTQKDEKIPSGIEDRVHRSLKFAGLPTWALSMGPNPDTGEPSWVLDATIQQYSAFLVCLAVQARSVGAMEAIVDSVQAETKSDGDTRFWIGNLTIPRITR